MDEFDALLEEPFDDDVDWTAVDTMAAATAAEPHSDSEIYFASDDGLDDAFLDDLRRLEERAMASWDVTSARRPQGQHILHVASSAAGPSQSYHVPTRGPIPAPPAVHGASMLSQPASSPPPRRAQSNGNISISLGADLPPDKFSNDVPYRTQSAALKRTHDKSPASTAPRKRRRSSTDTGQPSPTKRRKTRVREAKSEVLKSFENMLECPICFDTMAASHSLSCGHSACGTCLSKWLCYRGGRASCFSCRARHKRGLIPNFVVDAMAVAYFEERGKNAAEDQVRRAAEDRMHWETRRAEGKAAVREASENSSRAKKVAPDPAPPEPEPFPVISEIVVVSPYSSPG